MNYQENVSKNSNTIGQLSPEYLGAKLDTLVPLMKKQIFPKN